MLLAENETENSGKNMGVLEHNEWRSRSRSKVKVIECIWRQVNDSHQT